MAAAPLAVSAAVDPAVHAALAAQIAAARSDGRGFAYYTGRRSRIEPTAWVALTSHPDAQAALSWLIANQDAHGWIRDDRQAPINYGFNALALLAMLTDARAANHAERLGQALLQVKGLAYGPSPVVRQDNSLQAWSWVDNTLSWVEPTAYALIAIKRARQAGLLETSAATARARIDVGERMLEDRACASGGWNYGNAQVFGQDLLAHGPTTSLALIALQDRGAAGFVQRGLEFLIAQASAERSGSALALAAIALRLLGRSDEALQPLMREQVTVSAALGNTVTMATLSVALDAAPRALAPFTLGAPAPATGGV